MKRTIISIVIIAICFCLCACASTTELVESSDGDEFVTVPEVITEPATEPMSKEAALALFESTIRDMFAKTGNFSATAFSGDEARINFGVVIDSLAADLYYAKQAGHDKNYGTWVELKDYMLEHYDTICETAEHYGLTDAEIYLYVLNDSNTSLAMLTIYNGAVIADYMSQ